MKIVANLLTVWLEQMYWVGNIMQLNNIVTTELPIW